MTGFLPGVVMREPADLVVLRALSEGSSSGAGYAVLRGDTGLSGGALDRCLGRLEGAGLVELVRGELLGMGTVWAELTEAGRAALGTSPDVMEGNLRERRGVSSGSPADSPLGGIREGEGDAGSGGLVIDPVGDPVGDPVRDATDVATARDAHEERELGGQTR